MKRTTPAELEDMMKDLKDSAFERSCNEVSKFGERTTTVRARVRGDEFYLVDGDDLFGETTIKTVRTESSEHDIGPHGNNDDVTITVGLKHVRTLAAASAGHAVKVSSATNGANFKLEIRGGAEAAMMLISLRDALNALDLKA